MSFCVGCAHWYASNAEGSKGACKRFPPQAGGVVMVQGLQGPQPMVLWGSPETAPNDLCGEWTLRAQVIAQ